MTEDRLKLEEEKPLEASTGLPEGVSLPRSHLEQESMEAESELEAESYGLQKSPRLPLTHIETAPYKFLSRVRRRQRKYRGKD